MVETKGRKINKKSFTYLRVLMQVVRVMKEGNGLQTIKNIGGTS
jgi:hypothetical protein